MALARASIRISRLSNRRRFHSTAAELQRAHAFAYGGALIQDIGYYPLSARVFGDMTHYVRSGDFVVALLAEARTVDEYAFAIGALSHYVADNDGHPLAVNRAVPLIYPKLEAKYGPSMTFEENPGAHLKTEFGFDVVQVAQGHYPPDAYRDFIGFEVARPVLERAFLRTYGLRFDDVFADLDLSIGTFRRTVSTVVPAMTKGAWEMKGKEITRQEPTMTSDRFLFALSRSEYEQRWGRQYDRPNIGEKLVAVLMRAVPKLGPFKALAFKPPTPEAERLFLRSLTTSIDRYREVLSTLSKASRRRSVRICCPFTKTATLWRMSTRDTRVGKELCVNSTS